MLTTFKYIDLVKQICYHGLMRSRLPTRQPCRCPILHSLVNCLESALPKNAPMTAVESALPKCLNLKIFRIRTYETNREGVGSVNQSSVAINNYQRWHRHSCLCSYGLNRTTRKARTRIESRQKDREQTLNAGHPRFRSLAQVDDRSKALPHSEDKRPTESLRWLGWNLGFRRRRNQPRWPRRSRSCPTGRWYRNSSG
jgi:hypothetical protein